MTAQRVVWSVSQERTLIHLLYSLPEMTCVPSKSQLTLSTPQSEVNIVGWQTVSESDRNQAIGIFVEPPFLYEDTLYVFLRCSNVSSCFCQISHAAVSALCRSIKLQCELYSSRQIAICLDPYCGLGFVLWCLARYRDPSSTLQFWSLISDFSSVHTLVLLYVLSYSVYSGHQSILIPPFELESCLSLWLSTLSQYRIRDTFCSYSVMELCTKGLGTQTELLKVGVAYIYI